MIPITHFSETTPVHMLVFSISGGFPDFYLEEIRMYCTALKVFFFHPVITRIPHSAPAQKYLALLPTLGYSIRLSSSLQPISTQERLLSSDAVLAAVQTGLGSGIKGIYQHWLINLRGTSQVGEWTSKELRLCWDSFKPKPLLCDIFWVCRVHTRSFSRAPRLRVWGP